MKQVHDAPGIQLSTLHRRTPLFDVSLDVEDQSGTIHLKREQAVAWLPRRPLDLPGNSQLPHQIVRPFNV